MNSISQTPSRLVDQLLATYHQEHPFFDKPEHKQEQGLRTEYYYQDAATYSQECCEWVQEQMQKQGITIHIYRLSKGRIIQDRCFYDLTVDTQVVYHEILSLVVHDYILCTLENHDVYCEAHMTEPLSGQRLRESHNAMEAKYANDGTYIPQYSYRPGPYTSERHLSTSQSEGTENETNCSQKERQG